jgi:tetratricopeptide (TPR) repeat protein
MDIDPKKQKLVIYIVLTIATLAVFWQVHHFDFIDFDDNFYVTENSHVWSGLTLDGVRYAFTTKYTDLWNPLVWLSFMFDYHLYGLNAGGYHLTNLILHILSTLLLFWLFNRMTQAIWRSAFVAAVFALHPMHVESVVWIAERKDVLSAFFWMLTLCLYVYYTEKPIIRRYLPVLLCFTCALMSKPMVITLPVIMILLDYWPLDRLQSRKILSNLPGVISVSTNKGKKKTKSKREVLKENISPPRVQKLSEPRIAGIIPLWQLKEKTPFFVLSVVLVIITLYPTNISSVKLIPLSDRITNALVTFMIYLEKTFWPHNLALFYPFPAQIPLWQVIGASLLILVITSVVIVMMKRLPYLFAGWLWYAITILPVIGIKQIASDPYAMADRYHYLPSVGIAVMLAWGIPQLIKNEETRKKILFPAAVTIIIFMSVLTWQQCGYWKNSTTLYSHTLRVTKDNYVMHNSLGNVLFKEGKNKEAIDNYSKAISLKPDYAPAYSNRGVAYVNIRQYRMAVEDYSRAVRLKPDYAIAYNNRGIAYANLGQHQMAIEDYKQATGLKSEYANAYFNWGLACANLGQYQQAIEKYNEAIRLKPDYAIVYNNRAVTYLVQGNKEQGCRDAQRACMLGVCKMLELAKSKGLCN